MVVKQVNDYVALLLASYTFTTHNEIPMNS